MPDATDHRLGELERTADAWRLRFVRELGLPPERVWRALTDPDELREWFPTSIDGERAAGATLTFTFKDDQAPAFQGTMLACEPPRLLELTWGGDVLRFELEPTPTGTRLSLFDTLDERGKAARDAGGWHTCLDRLERLLAGLGPDDRPPPTDWHDVQPLYAQSFGPEASSIGPPEGLG